jgi:hypothetical protein
MYASRKMAILVLYSGYTLIFKQTHIRLGGSPELESIL